MDRQHQAALKQYEIDSRASVEMEKTRMDNETRIVVAQIAAGAKAESATPNVVSPSEAPEPDEPEESAEPDVDMRALLSHIMQSLDQLFASRAAPRQVHRGPDGMAMAIDGRQIMRDENGNITGIK